MEDREPYITGGSVIKLDEAKKEIDAYFKNVTVKQLNKDLKAAGVDFYVSKKEKSKVAKLVICSEVSRSCKGCVCSKPHEKHTNTDEGLPCTNWDICDYKGRKVRCTKVI